MVNNYTVTFFIQPANFLDDGDTADGEMWIRDAVNGTVLVNDTGPWSLNYNSDYTIDLDAHPVLEFEIQAQSSSPASVELEWAFFEDSGQRFAQINADDSQLPVTETDEWTAAPPSLDSASVNNNLGVDLSWSHPTASAFDVLWDTRTEYDDGSPDESGAYNVIAPSISDTSTAHADPDPGDNYYSVQALANGHKSLIAEEAVATILSPPSNVQQEVVGDDEIAVTWDDDTDNDYNVEVSEDGGAFNLVGTTSSTEITYVATPSTNTHTFRVRVDSGNSVSDWAVSETVDTDPTNLSVTGVAGQEVSLAWDGVRDATGYEVLLAEASGDAASDYSSEATPAAPPYTMTGLEDGEQYYIRVRATYPGTPSQLTNEVDATTPLPAPTFGTLDAGTPREITVPYTLEDNSTDGDVLIERSADGGATWTEIATVTDLSTTAYTDTGLLDGQEYTYRLTRRTDHAETTSATVSAITILPAPTNLTASAIGDTSVEYAWDATHNQGQTRVEYRRAGEGDDWTTYETVDNETEAATVDGLLTGEQYGGRVVAQTDDAETEDE